MRKKSSDALRKKKGKKKRVDRSPRAGQTRIRGDEVINMSLLVQVGIAALRSTIHNFPLILVLLNDPVIFFISSPILFFYHVNHRVVILN
jgi:hypothetical protein